MAKKTLIRGGRVLAMTPGSTESAFDVLIDGDRLADLAPSVDCPDAEIVDASGCIVMPGLVDTHRHVWETQLRTVATDWSLFDYFAQMRLMYASFYEPEDVYLGNHVGALEALSAGITTMVDHCHVLHTPEHGDEAVRGLVESGIRSVFCYGTFESPDWTGDAARTALPAGWRRDDALRVRRDLLPSRDSLVTFGFAPAEIDANPFDVNVGEIRLARELGAHRISCHVSMGAYDSGTRFVAALGREGLLGEDLLFVHGSSLTDDELRAMADSGAAVSATPETEMQMGMGFPVAFRARAAGVRASLGVDIVSNYSGDLFAQMRLALQAARAQENDRYEKRDRAPRCIRPAAREVLELGTREGAVAAGLGDRTGTLEKGKQADVILVRTDAIHMVPAIDAVGAVVLNANASDVDTVFVAGRCVKKDGKLVGVDWPSLSRRLQASSRRVVEGMRSLDLPGVESMAAQLIPRLE